MNKQTKASAAAMSGHPRPNGRFEGWKKTCDGAVEEQVIVALPGVFVAVRVIVFGAVKNVAGAPKLQAGMSTAPEGEAVIAADNVTAPAKPYVPATEMTHDADWPGWVILDVAFVQVCPGLTLNSGVPTPTVVEGETGLAL